MVCKDCEIMREKVEELKYWVDLKYHTENNDRHQNVIDYEIQINEHHAILFESLSSSSKEPSENIKNGKCFQCKSGNDETEKCTAGGSTLLYCQVSYGKNCSFFRAKEPDTAFADTNPDEGRCPGCGRKWHCTCGPGDQELRENIEDKIKELEGQDFVMMEDKAVINVLKDLLSLSSKEPDEKEELQLPCAECKLEAPMEYFSVIPTFNGNFLCPDYKNKLLEPSKAQSDENFNAVFDSGPRELTNHEKKLHGMISGIVDKCVENDVIPTWNDEKGIGFRKAEPKAPSDETSSDNSTSSPDKLEIRKCNNCFWWNKGNRVSYRVMDDGIETDQLIPPACKRCMGSLSEWEPSVGDEDILNDKYKPMPPISERKVKPIFDDTPPTTTDSKDWKRPLFKKQKCQTETNLDYCIADDEEIETPCSICDDFKTESNKRFEERCTEWKSKLTEWFYKLDNARKVGYLDDVVEDLVDEIHGYISDTKDGDE